MFDYDLLLAQSIQSGKAPDVAVRDFLTDLAKKEGAVNSFLDGLGIVGGVAACSSGVGTAACVAGAIAAIASANHLSADIQKAVTGQEAKTALVAILTSEQMGYSQEQAEKLQTYIDLGVIVVTVGVGGYKFVVDGKRLAKGDEALAKLSSTSDLPGLTLPREVADTFSGGVYTNRKLLVDTPFYKYHGVDNRTGKK